MGMSPSDPGRGQKVRERDIKRFDMSLAYGSNTHTENNHDMWQT